MKKILKIIMAAVMLVATVEFTGCESCKREMKSISSNIGGGLCRRVTVYDYNGQEIKHWEGKFDVRDTQDNYVYFDMEDGKRVVVHGGILINEEILDRCSIKKHPKYLESDEEEDL